MFFHPTIIKLLELWASEEIEIHKCKNHSLYEDESVVIEITPFQWMQFYESADERQLVVPDGYHWMTCIKNGYKYRLVARGKRIEKLNFNILLNKFKYDSILFRRFVI